MGTTQQRFMRRGVTQFLFLKDIAAATNIPTRAELTGEANATQLSGAVSDVEGFSLENTPPGNP
ncbi:hypothetical protein [Streptomyces sp. NPDC053367]|uniref:phage tail tube protein n=1 Tax=Streptomyces sp. NPDC053367 TaxID=3365700 RepID=UPI0037CF9911